MTPHTWILGTDGTVRRWAAACRAAGLDVHALPTHTVRPTREAAGAADRIRALAPDLVVITSAEAALALPEGAGSGWHTAAVGDHTADAARRRGFDVQFVGRSGGGALADELVPPRPRALALHLAGRSARAETAEALERGGWRVSTLVVYGTHAEPDLEGRTAAAPPPGALVIGSPRAADALDRVVGSSHHDVPVVAVGSTTARHLAALGYQRVDVPAEPGAAGVVEVLISLIRPTRSPDPGPSSP